MRARAVRRGTRGALLGLGILWWWATARLLLVPGAGVLEAAVAAGGWGLSLLPVHCMPKGRTEGVLAGGRWRRAWTAGAGAREVGVPEAGTSAVVASPGTGTTASPRPRSGEESGPWRPW
ncbi:hypothetical protein [Streptomyces prasinus]|uniref:hypothetical protein n=1 Tax=Streptomyces prasinus TaxID=67345 RepID=UPI00099E676F|nr:hypothetical protein [Streptomyces prasinus]